MMASYQYGFDAPPRPALTSRPKLVGTYKAHLASNPHSTPATGLADRQQYSGRTTEETAFQRAPQKQYGQQTKLPKPVSRGQVSTSESTFVVNINPDNRSQQTRALPEVTNYGHSEAPYQADLKGVSSGKSRHVLQRKPYTIAQHRSPVSEFRTQPSSNSPSSWPLHSPMKDEQEQPIHPVSFDKEESLPLVLRLESQLSPPIIPELDRYGSGTDQRWMAPTRMKSFDMPPKLATHDLPPPTPLSSGLSGNSGYSYSASPSTRFSESPGPGSYSRDTTPTSMSSQSPGMIAPLRMTTRFQQASPINTRPPVTRRRMGSGGEDKDVKSLDKQGLAALRESSLASSSSNSTAKEHEKAVKTTSDKKKNKKLSTPPPCPPPRKSSQRFKTPSPSESSHLLPLKISKSVAPVLRAISNKTLPQNQRNVAIPDVVKIPPRRPSREGTPDLQAQFEETAAIVQSNMTGILFSPNRRLSMTAPPHSGMSLRSPSQTYSPSPVQAVKREATPALAGLGIIPDLRGRNFSSPPRTSDGLRTPSPSISTPKSRFGFFSRKGKNYLGSTTTDPKENGLRKGPAAGTGHEGYGRYALGGRSGVPGPRDRSHRNSSSSQDSLNSQRSQDPFLLQRMSPVIIAGGGEIVSNQNETFDLTRTESNQSVFGIRPSQESNVVSSQSNLERQIPCMTQSQPYLPQNSTANQSSTSLVSKSSTVAYFGDLDSHDVKSSPVVRKSKSRLKANEHGELKFPKPFVAYGDGSSALSSQAASFTSDETRLEGIKQVETLEVNAVKQKKLLKEARPKSPRKWNFFHRSQPKPTMKLQQADVVSAIVSPTDDKAVAYYSIIDSSEPEDDEPLKIEDILLDADVVNPSHLEVNPTRLDNYSADSMDMNLNESPAQHRYGPSDNQSKILNSLDPWVPLINHVVAQGETLMDQPLTRPSRLSQVGRIPPVLPTRPLQMSSKSFSRPFARISMNPPEPNSSNIDRQSIAVRPSLESSPSTTFTQLAKVAEKQEPQEISFSDERAFLVISPRKNSSSTSASSGGMSFAGTTAVVPQADAELEEDEIWDEYDDLIGREELRVTPPTTLSCGIPFQYESFESPAREKAKLAVRDSSVLDVTWVMQKTTTENSLLELTLGPSTTYRPDTVPQVIEAMVIPSPTSPLSFTELFSGYEERNSSLTDNSEAIKRDFRPPSANSKSGSISGNFRQSGISKPETSRKLQQESPTAQTNLRLGSMTVSKWLTFGHALFSPAREDILQLEDKAKHHSVLVIDGLGNDDWSFFAAETFPSVTFFNLSPRPSRTQQSRRASMLTMPLTPVNHRQVSYTNFLDKFPFPRDTFTVVVIRFLPTLSEAALRNLIAEAKRVLKPSGYLELSILDLEMMNMGNRTRRAVRALKVNLSIADPTISLALASDTILRMISKRGFHDIKSCRVGVPVASAISAPLSTDEAEISLADMMRDSSSAADSGITKMVAKVGRWWFMRCYEMGIISAGEISSSLFADEAIITECEQWGTSFKLLVCHAQKPIVSRRRTASV